jgi:integrase
MSPINELPDGRGTEVRWRTLDGRSRRKRFPAGRKGKAAAQQLYVKLEHDKLLGNFVDPSAGKIHFEELARSWLETQTFDDGTRRAVTSRLKNHILPALGKLEVRKIRPSVVQALLKRLSELLAPGTVKAILAILSAILEAAVEDGVLAKNPCRSRAVRAPSPERERVVPWTVAQLQDVIAAHPPEWSAVPIVGAGTGLRQGELFGLTVDDVDFLRRRVLVRHQVKPGLTLGSPKGRKTREVPLADIVATALAEHVRRTPVSDGGAVFHRDGKLVDAGLYNRTIWKPALIEAGLAPSRRNGMHILRHTFASLQLEHGTSVRALAEYLGHGDPGFTLRTYAHVMPTSEDKARAAVELALGDLEVLGATGS